MDKSPDAFRTISEVADALETPAHVLRFWETRFPQIRPVKRAGGRRYYRPSDVALLTGIKRLLHDDGLTIRGVQKILREHGVRHVSGLAAGEDGHRSRLEDPLDIMEDRAAAEDAEMSAVVAFPRGDATAAGDAGQRSAVPNELWPDADLPPPDDNGTLVLHQPEPAAPAPHAALSDDEDARLMAALADVVNEAVDVPSAPATRPVVEANDVAPPVADSTDQDDMLLASVLGVAGQSAPVPSARADDGWRSLPLAPGEEMPLATRLRALPKGALAHRSADVAAWVARARDLAQRMNRPDHGGRG